MALELLERVWDPPTEENADWFHVEANSIVLLDGAAPLAQVRVSSFANDTVWFVRRFVELFGATRLRKGDTALERVAEARALLSEEYRASCERAGLAPRETPFACLAVAHELDDVIEFLNLGDLTTLIQMRDGRIRKFGDSAVRGLDRQALELLRVELASGVTPHAARLANIRPCLLGNRELRNVLPGYDVLDVNVDCTRAERLSCDKSNMADCILMSDGFYRLVDTFGRYSDASLFRAARERGLQDLLEELRAIEAGDPDCIEYPRFKRCDDATALWFRCPTP